jgi:glycine cleavage system H protein
MGKWNTPSDLKYRDSDEWIRVDGNTAAIGISDYAQDQLNDIVFVELPEVGATFAKGDVFGVVESVKAASDLHIPVSGTVIEVNSAAEEEPELLNTDPYDKGWIIKIALDDASELDALMDSDAYETYCEDR